MFKNKNRLGYLVKHYLYWPRSIFQVISLDGLKYFLHNTTAHGIK